MEWYRKDVEELAPEDCWDRLRADGVARLAVVVDGAPEIFPINYVVDRGTIVFRAWARRSAARSRAWRWPSRSTGTTRRPPRRGA